MVYERQNKEQVGKGYALNFLLDHIDQDYSLDSFDGFFVFDADNLLKKDYISQMNRTSPTAMMSSPAIATPKTMATTGSPPGTPCGSSGRRST